MILSDVCICNLAGTCHLCKLTQTDPEYARLLGVPTTYKKTLPCIHEEGIHTFCPRGDEMLHVRGCALDHTNVTRNKCYTSCIDYAHNFDRVVVINLKRRPDRLIDFHNNLKEEKWPFMYPDTFAAMDGNCLGAPNFNSGGGAYGCKQSHVRILEQAINDGIRNILVLEDDAVLLPGGVDRIVDFIRRVPDDWDQLMLGGQHMHEPIPYANGIVKATDCQRTHAYVIRGQFMHDMYVAWMDAKVHIDWVMGPMQRDRNVYCMQKFAFGQAAGVSDINHGIHPLNTWNGPT